MTSIATYSGIEIINSSKFTTFTTELKIMQTEVNNIYQDDNATDIGDEITGTIKEQADIVFAELANDTESGITSQEGYKYWSNDLVKQLGIEGVEQDFFVNMQQRSVISYEGLKYDGKMYYTLSQLPDGLYNVTYENPNTAKPTFKITTSKQGLNKWRIDISDIKYEQGYIDKWQVQYQLQGKSYWNTTEDMSFIVDTQGTYSIKIVNESIESEVQNVTILYVNEPELLDGMQAITFAEDGTDVIVTNTAKRDWYSYEETTDDDMTDGGTTEGGNSRWANAKLNGNYYVWIPRYAYKIDTSVTYTSQSGTSHKIDVKFVGTEVTSSNVEEKLGSEYADYIVHPAFTFGTKELSGFWIGKYETSGTTEAPTIKPNVTSLREINVSTMFSTAQTLSTTNYDAHMMKNMEWGACAYLAQSQYGRNGTEISVNQCSDYYTGVGTGTGTSKIYNSTYTWADATDEQKYNGSLGKLASTTGNIYGVYDMAGGAWDYVMGFYGTDGIPTVGSTGFTTFPDKKYYDLYYSTSADNTNIGDALYETSGWNSDAAGFVNSNFPVFLRGGDCNFTYYGGVFYFSINDGSANNVFSFRICLAVQ